MLQPSISVVVNRSGTNLATTILAQRDSYLAQVDPLLAAENRVTLPSAIMFSTRLFDGETSAMVSALESLRKDSEKRRSVNTLASLAQKGVEKQSVASSSSSGQKHKKKHKKDK